MVEPIAQNLNPTTPKRIQMSRQHPWRADNPDAVIVARPSKWGNPYTVAESGSNREAVRMYLLAFINDPVRLAVASQIRTELAGHDLACWCPLDQPCHADVLLDIANGDV